MFGIVSEPVDTTFATAEPEIVPNSADDTTETLAGPPTKRPATTVETSTNRRPSPIFCATAPNSTKWNTTVETTQSGMPNMPSAGK